MNHLEFPVIGAKWTIGFFGLFHLSVAALAIGLGFIVTILQVIAYKKKIRRYDLFAKRIQLFHVCIYNVGTINAIGLVFVLSGLYPQFWAQIFDQFFWPLMVEEFLFLLLATTLTFHYFFWDHLWGHKVLHIWLGGLLIPFFFLQMYIINGLGGFMLTPGVEESQVSLFAGVLGWDSLAMYNPSFLMLQLHRSFANVSYAGFMLAAWCGIRLYFAKSPASKDYYEDCGRTVFFIAFAAFLSIPVIGYFYSHVLMHHAQQAFMDLMYGGGDIYVLGVDTWWLKHILVAVMLGMSLVYFRKQDKTTAPISIPVILVYGIALFYLVFYIAMGMVMTWAFFWWMLFFAVAAYFLGKHLISHHAESGRSVFLVMGIISFLTVMLGGYVREASRPRFVDRISHYNNVFVPEERQQYLMLPITPEDVAAAEEQTASAPKADPGTANLIQQKCVSCHTLDIVKEYEDDDWEDVVSRMRAYGTELTDEEAAEITKHLAEGKPY